jgi:hypothetical protein
MFESVASETRSRQGVLGIVHPGWLTVVLPCSRADNVFMVKFDSVSAMRPAGLMLLLAVSLGACCFAGQSTDKASALTIRAPLKHYLGLSDEQVTKLENTLKSYDQFVATKNDAIRSLRTRAAVDPSVNANRGIESNQAEIENARIRVREEISSTLSSEQISRLVRLRASASEDAAHSMLAAEAADLNLIDNPNHPNRQPFGGTTSVFATDTESQHEVPEQPNRGKPQSKRNPPSSPPQ